MEEQQRIRRETTKHRTDRENAEKQLHEQQTEWQAAASEQNKGNTQALCLSVSPPFQFIEFTRLCINLSLEPVALQETEQTMYSLCFSLQ